MEFLTTGSEELAPRSQERTSQNQTNKHVITLSHSSVQRGNKNLHFPAVCAMLPQDLRNKLSPTC